MNFDAISPVVDELDDLEPEEVEAPKRRERRRHCPAGRAIPAEINSAFLEDLAFERAISTALGLASGLSGAWRARWRQRPRWPVRTRHGRPAARGGGAMRPRARRLDGPRPGALRKGKLRNALAHAVPSVVLLHGLPGCESRSSPEPGNELDAEMNAVKVATDLVISNLGLIQQTNGQLANASVGYQQIQRCVRRDLNPPTYVVEFERQLFPWRFGFLPRCGSTSAIWRTCHLRAPRRRRMPRGRCSPISRPSRPGSVMAADLAPGAVTSAALGPGLALPASPATGDNSTAIATTAFVQATIAGLGGVAYPTTLPADGGRPLDQFGSLIDLLTLNPNRKGQA